MTTGFLPVASSIRCEAEGDILTEALDGKSEPGGIASPRLYESLQLLRV